MKPAVFVSLIALIGLDSDWMGPQERFGAEVRGLRIVAAPAAAEGDEMRAFNWFPGTSISILLRTPEKNLMGWEHSESRIDSMKDDLGRNLLADPNPDSRSFTPSGIDPNVRFRPSGDAVFFEVSGPAIPSKGAKVIAVKGSLSLLSGSSKEERRAENVSLAEGKSFSLGDISFQVKKVGKPSWDMGGYVFAVELETSQDLAALDGISFLDSNGKECESQQAMSMKMGKLLESREYHFKKKLESVTVVARFWKDLKKFEAPFELEVGLGF